MARNAENTERASDVSMNSDGYVAKALQVFDRSAFDDDDDMSLDGEMMESGESCTRCWLGEAGGRYYCR